MSEQTPAGIVEAVKQRIARTAFDSAARYNTTATVTDITDAALAAIRDAGYVIRKAGDETATSRPAEAVPQ